MHTNPYPNFLVTGKPLTIFAICMYIDSLFSNALYKKWCLALNGQNTLSH